MTILIDYVEVTVMLTDSDESNQLRVMPYFDWCHYLSSKLLRRSFRIHIILYLLYGNLSTSPLSLKNLWWITVSYLLLKNKCGKFNNILLCISFDLLYNEFLKVNKISCIFWWWVFWLGLLNLGLYYALFFIILLLILNWNKILLTFFIFRWKYWWNVDWSLSFLL